MTDESVKLLFVGKLKLQLRIITINQGELIVVDLNEAELSGFERLPGEKRRIHFFEYSGRTRTLKLPAARNYCSGESAQKRKAQATL